MRFRLSLLGLVSLALLLAACAPPPELRDPTLLDDTSIITGDPCAAPCWRGITPGETLWRDALTIVEDSADFENITTQEDEATDAIGAQWNQTGGAQCCQMVSEDGETVNLLFLRVRPGATLGELIDVHGEPGYAVGTPVSDDQAIVNLVYPELPMIVFVFAAGPEAGELSETSEIIGMLYTTPDDMDLFMQTNSLHEWQGYEPFSTYTNAEGSDFDITPSVTITPTGTAE